MLWMTKKKALIIGNSRGITVVLHEASMNSALCVYIYRLSFRSIVNFCKLLAVRHQRASSMPLERSKSVWNEDVFYCSFNHIHQGFSLFFYWYLSGNCRHKQVYFSPSRTQCRATDMEAAYFRLANRQLHHKLKNLFVQRSRRRCKDTKSLARRLTRG